MTSIVIPYRESYSGNTELTYCLRSIEKHLKGYGEIFVIGQDPKVEGITHIEASDEPEYSKKERNVYLKLLIACDNPQVSDPFLYINDDHYLLTDYIAREFPYYCSKEWGGQGFYLETIGNTKRMYGEILNFDLHCPILIHKKVFKKLSELDWSVKFGYCIKTSYMQYSTSFALACADLKIIDPALTAEQIKDLLRGRDWFSVGDHVFRAEGMKQVMEELYPIKQDV